MTSAIKRWEPGPIPWQVLANSDDTGGAFLFGEARIEPGMPAPGLHVHEREFETIYVIEGVMTVELGDERYELRNGDFIVMPPGVPHRFGNLSDETVRVVGVVSPTDIERMFAEEEEYFAQLSGPPDEARIAQITAPYGVTILGPPLTV
jgi:quercetin dioxygenase-like cupin family protein